MKPSNYDFSGWATRHNIKCSDGRTIKPSAFKEQDGKTVSLVWNHQHNSIHDVLGKAYLEHRDEGVYAYCSFNDNPEGLEAKEAVKHGDITALSIYANHLEHANGKEVVHGRIQEVSLVLAGANMGAYIENVACHSDEQGNESVDLVQIFNPSEEIELYHSEQADDANVNNNENVENNNADNENKDENKEEDLSHAENKDETIQDVFDTFNEKQKKVFYYMLKMGIMDAVAEAEADAKHSDENINEEDNSNMKINVFEKSDENKDDNVKVLSHSEMKEIFEEARNSGSGSLKATFLAHGYETVQGVDDTLAHSITDIGNLYPEYKNVTPTPKVLGKNKPWVADVNASVHNVPFTRIKSTVMDITGDDARAKGYVKGAQKVEEVISAAKRTTDPATIYKLQKLDRDDVIDITDFDVVAFLKGELQAKIEAERARAILMGDGRSAASGDRIDPTKIRPIWGDNSLYVTNKVLVKDAGMSDYEFASKVIDEVTASQVDYEGSGTPAFYSQEGLLINMKLIKDTNGHRLYKGDSEIASAMGVSRVVPVQPMKNATRTSEGYKYTLLGIMVNLDDYDLGANKMGGLNFFDDFDLNFNKFEYLMEERRAGALVSPKSAVTFELKEAVEEEAQG